MAKSKYPGPAESLEKYETLVALADDIDRKGAANPYTSLNGHMFSFLNKEGALALRLSDDDREAFLDEFGGGEVLAHGSVMRGYVHIPDTLLDDTDALFVWFERGRDYIGTLKPKPTKKKKK